MRFLSRAYDHIRKEAGTYGTILACTGIMIGAHFLSGFGRGKEEVLVSKENPRVNERALEKRIDPEDDYTPITGYGIQGQPRFYIGRVGFLSDGSKIDFEKIEKEKK